MAFEPVRDYFAQEGLEDRIQLFERNTESVQEAAAWVGAPLGSIAKSIVFDMGNDQLIMVVCSSDDRIDGSKFKYHFGQEATMLPDDEVLSRVGHVVGGVCPFDLPDNIDVYLDMSLRRFPYVYPAAGSRDTVIKLTPQELERHSFAKSWKYLGVGYEEFGRGGFNLVKFLES